VQFLLFDVSVTLVFLVGYVGIVALQRRRALAAPGAALPAPARDGGKPAQAPQQERPATQCCQEWPRLSAPR
jgi:hypothetical protein